MSESWVLLRFGHMRHREEDELILVQFYFRGSGLQILFEGRETGVIENAVSFQVGMDIVDAEVDLQFELQPPGILINIPHLARVPEKLIPAASVIHAKDKITIRLVFLMRVDLCLGFEVGSLCSEGVVCVGVAIG